MISITEMRERINAAMRRARYSHRPHQNRHPNQERRNTRSHNLRNPHIKHEHSRSLLYGRNTKPTIRRKRITCSTIKHVTFIPNDTALFRVDPRTTKPTQDIP